MILLPQYRAPQRHTVTLRIMSEINPLRLLQVMFSQHDEEQLDTDLAPMFCRVDFINSLLSQELVNIITEWHDALPEASFGSKFLLKFKNKQPWIHDCNHLVFSFVYIGLAIAIIMSLMRGHEQDLPISLEHATWLAIWTFVAFSLLRAINVVAHWVATSANRCLQAYNRHMAIMLTRGDENRQKRLEKENRTNGRRFFVRLATAFLLNVIAGLVVAWLLMPSAP